MNLLRKMFGWADGKRPLDLKKPMSEQSAARAMETGFEVSARSSMALSGVWGCVNLLAGTISSLPLQVYASGKDGARDILRDHPLYSVLHDSPNHDQTALDFWDLQTMAIELWGNAYARKERLRGRVIGLTPVRPDIVKVSRASDGVLRYRWSENGKSHEVTEDDMLHIRGPGGDALGGLSTLTFARPTFSLAMAANVTAAAMFKNGLRPSGALQFADWLSDENREIARTYMVEGFMGAANTGKPFVAEGGVTWSAFSITPEDAQMLESRGFSIEEICRFFGVPPVMIQHSSATTSWPTGVEQQVLLFQKFTLRRRLKRIEAALEKQLLTTADRAKGVRIEFNLEGLLRGDSAGRAAFYKSGLNDGWLTINEVRGKENLPPVEGGDVPRIQKQNVPISALQGLIDGAGSDEV